ncbi:MAG TPA: DUF3817 domain-containing protein [Acidimicrobiia bacterium]
MVDFADDTSTELERKARALQWVAIVETASYGVLLAFWIAAMPVGIAVTGSVHGMIFLAFAAMVIMITPAIHWSWWFTALVLVTGPIGALIVFERLRREGVPEPELR